MWQVHSNQNIIYILQLPKQWWFPGIFIKNHFVMRLTDKLPIIFVKWLPALKVFHHSCLAALRELCTMDSMSTITFAGGVFMGKKVSKFRVLSGRWQNLWKLFMKEFISWVIRQKGESQNGCFKKAKHSKFSEKRTFLTSGMFTYACVSGVRNIRFFGKFGVLFFLETHVLRFSLFPYYRRYLVRNILHNAFVFKTPLLKFW